MLLILLSQENTENKPIVFALRLKLYTITYMNNMWSIPPEYTKGMGGEHGYAFNIETAIKYGNSMTINLKCRVNGGENSGDKPWGQFLDYSDTNCPHDLLCRQ